MASAGLRARASSGIVAVDLIPVQMKATTHRSETTISTGTAARHSAIDWNHGDLKVCPLNASAPDLQGRPPRSDAPWKSVGVLSRSRLSFSLG